MDAGRKRRGDKPYLRQRSARGFELTYTNAAGKQVTKTIHARTKAEARRLSDDFLQQAERVRLGLETAIEPMTLEAAFKRYSETASHKASWQSEEGRWRLHILELDKEGRARSALSQKLLHSITTHDVDLLLLEKHREEYAPQQVAHLKTHLRRLFTWAIREARILRGDNVASFAKLPEEVPESEPKAMSAEQLEVLFRKGTEDEADRLLLLTAAYTGERRKELLQLLWENVDLERGWIWVENSRRLKTKTRRSRPIPIHPDLLPYLRAGRRHARSFWAFPNAEGRQRSVKHWKAYEFLRKCMLRAGLLQGWVLECVARKPRPNPRQKLDAAQAKDIRERAKGGESQAALARAFGVSARAVALILQGVNYGAHRPVGGCGYASELVPEPATGACPTCGATLKARPVPLDFTFHDLRSTFGTHVVESTGSLRAAQLFLGHQDEATTKRYARKRDEFLQAQMGKVRLVAADKLPIASGGDWPQSAVSDDDKPHKSHELRPLAVRSGE